MAKRSRSAALLAVALALLAAAPATATFPGRNGEIAFTRQAGSRYVNQRFELLRFAARVGDPTREPVCSISSDPLRCWSFGPPLYGPDGSRFAATAPIDYFEPPFL